ncbi:MFS transporter [Geomonas subterranea]|uniref:MFS transporter n=1 Tax=Geomonas subterranea TaxID=2847989 RepID=A0ABX8LM00_9BACT|nr:MFS transporter [Geomonas subterranea]QXE91932.1 MFS transporter [Geomonas subterranea]QXM09976.1 MFS transporter [Geomonas subterranea]
MKEPVSLAYRRYALGLLLAVNLLNYIDRQVLFAVFPLIKADLSITDTELGLLGSAFMVSYMVIAPVFGWLGDHWDRVKLASTGVVIWSFATILAGFAPGYRSLLAARATVGVGEASFGTVSPGLIADFFEKEKRGSVLSWFYVAIPVGSALGYLLGGVLGQRFGWHSAFLMVGLPGLLIAVPLWFLRAPERPASGPSGQTTGEGGEGLSGYLQLFHNRSFVTNTLAMAAMTFAIGGLAQWIPTFLFRTHALNVEKANLMFGAVTVVAGILGTLVGGVLGDRWQQKSSKGYLLVSGWGFFIGAPFAAWAILARDVPSCMAAIFMAEFFLFLNTGPLNTVIINVTNPGMRAMAFAVNIFFIHALGDAISPSILGWFSDQWGLRSALLSTPLVMALAGVFCFVCGRFVARDMAQAEPSA